MRKFDIYKIGLSQLVSKYIGETEKHLHRILNAAKQDNIVSIIDRATLYLENALRFTTPRIDMLK